MLQTEPAHTQQIAGHQICYTVEFSVTSEAWHIWPARLPACFADNRQWMH